MNGCSILYIVHVFVLLGFGVLVPETMNNANILMQDTGQ